MNELAGSMTGIMYSSKLHVSLLICIILIIYLPSISATFLWDDEALIVNNEGIKNLSCVPFLFRFGHWPTESPETFYRPIQLTSYAFDYFLGRLNPVGYHLHNIVLHILNTLIMYLLLCSLVSCRLSSFIGALIFSVHPVHTEAVAYVSGRADLQVLFYLLVAAVLFFNMIEGRVSLLKQVSIIVLFLFAILSKEIAIVFPLVMGSICIINRDKCSKQVLFTVGSCAAVAVGYAVIRLLLMPQYAVDVYSFSFIQRITLSMKSFALYLGVILYPVGLHMERLLYPAQHVFEISFLMSVLVTVLFLAVWYAYRRNKTVQYALFWFALFILPVLNIFSLNATFAEHWLYVPFFGISLLIAEIFKKNKRSNDNKVGIVVATLFIGAYAVLSLLRVQDWHDPATFYLKTLQQNPDNIRIEYNLGTHYLKEGDSARAIERYTNVLRIVAKKKLVTAGESAGEILIQLLTKTYDNLGNAYQLQRNYAAAIALYEKALTLMPDHELSMFNLGTAYHQSGKYDEAERCYRNTLKINPSNEKAIRFLEQLTENKKK